MIISVYNNFGLSLVGLAIDPGYGKIVLKYTSSQTISQVVNCTGKLYALTITVSTAGYNEA